MSQLLIVIEFISKDSGGLLNCFIRVFWLEIMPNFSKFRLIFRQKWDKICTLALNLEDVNTLKIRSDALSALKVVHALA